MPTVFEKSITLIGTVVSILTFVLSVLNWLGVNIQLDASIPNKRVAITLLVTFAFIASYASAMVLVGRAPDAPHNTMLWFALTFSYVFAYLFLLDKCDAALGALASAKEQLVGMATVLNGALFFVKFAWQRSYPDGYSFGASFERFFPAWKYFLLTIGHIAVVYLLFTLLGAP
jgi:hypothetical protein